MNDRVLTTLPAVTLDRHAAILATSDAGKTYGAKGEAEQLLDAGKRVFVIDPTGVWWGLRFLPDGEKASPYNLPIFGGVGSGGRAPAMCDVPIGATMGARLGELVAEGDFSGILDVSRMTVGDRTRLLADFAEALAQHNRRPLVLFIDEAHLFMPQGRVADPQSARMLHGFNALVAIGRNFGIRCVLLTQRPAKLHKDSLSLVQTMVAMQVVSPQDRAAIGDWIKDEGDPQQGKEIMASLPRLQVGEGWVWSPRNDILSRIKFRPLRTFDSSKTPDDDAAAAGAGPRLAALDLEAIRGALTDDAAHVRVDSPTAFVDEARLQTAREKGFTDGVAEGRRLEAEDWGRRSLASYPEVQRMLRLAERNGGMNMARQLLEGLKKTVDEVVGGSSIPPVVPDDLRTRDDIRTHPLSLAPPAPDLPVAGGGRGKKRIASSRANAAPSPAGDPALEAPSAERKLPTAPTSEPPPGAAARILATLRALPRTATAEEIAIAGCFAPKSGYLNAGFKALREGGWIQTAADGSISAAAAGDAADLVFADVVETWATKVGGAGGRILRYLDQVGGGPAPATTRPAICIALNIAPTSGYANAGFAALRNIPLIEEVEGSWRLVPILQELRLERGGRHA